MLHIPKLSDPLVKDIRTGEGIAEWILGLAIAVLTACGNLSVSHFALYTTIIAVVKGLRRGLLKLTTVEAGLGIGAPIPPTFSDSAVKTVDGVLAEIEAMRQEIQAFWSGRHGVPLGDSGVLAPNPPGWSGSASPPGEDVTAGFVQGGIRPPFPTSVGVASPSGQNIPAMTIPATSVDPKPKPKPKPRRKAPPKGTGSA